MPRIDDPNQNKSEGNYDNIPNVPPREEMNIAIKIAESFDWKKFVLPKDAWIIQERIAYLSHMIGVCNHYYYKTDYPLLSDGQYDQLFAQLQTLEDRFPQYRQETSPTQSLRDQKITWFWKVNHIKPLLSLQNTYNDTDIRARWVRVEKHQERVMNESNGQDHQRDRDTVTYIVEPKFDGIAVALRYEYGRLVNAATRWDGYVWEDITTHCTYIPTIPKVVEQRKSMMVVVVRWEIIMGKSSLEVVNQEAIKTWGSLFANVRNAAAWTLRHLTPLMSAKRWLMCVVYELLYGRDYDDHWWDESGITNDSQLLDYLEWCWFKTPNVRFVVDTIRQVIDICDDKNLKKKLDNDDIEYDWLVIKINEWSMRQKVWYTGHHPKWAVAFKYPAIQAVTQLVNVEFQVWRTGQITPVADVRPVQITWSTVSRATLHNFDQLKSLDIKKWDMVWIQKSGEVIPYIVWPIKDLRTWNEEPILMPHQCPSCGEKLTKETDVVALVCANHACIWRRIAMLQHALWKQALDLKGMWDATVEVLVRQGFVEWLEDLMKMLDLEYWIKLRSLPWFAEKKISLLLKEIQWLKYKELRRWLHALSIAWVGKKVAQDLQVALMDTQYTSCAVMITYLCNKERLLWIGWIWEVVASAIVEFFQQKKIHDLLDWRARAWVEVFQNASMKKVQPNISHRWWVLSGLTIAVTWLFPIARKVLVEFLQHHWALIADRVTRDCTMLLVGDEASSKVALAQKVWVTTHTLEEFILLYTLGEHYEWLLMKTASVSWKSTASQQQQMSLF
jgi:DNA ligase (NAD+)